MTDNRDGPAAPHLPFPFETLRHWYVTLFGGRSDDLRPGELGIRSEALRQNTKLVPHQDRVTISVMGQDTPRPLYMRESFAIVPLDAQRPRALELSPHGEAVLPAASPWEVMAPGELRLEQGERLLLNGVAARVFGTDPRELLARMLRRQLRRSGQGR